MKKNELITVGAFGIFAALFIALMVMHKPKALGTDNWCQNNCIQRGFGESYCMRRCSYDPAVQREYSGNTADPRCLSSCQSSGQSPAACKKSCSYY